MELRRPIQILLAAVITAGALLLAACGGSDEPSGTVNQPISVGTAQDEVDPSGGAGGGEDTAAEGGDTAAEGEGGGAEGDPAAGKAVFDSAGCGGCHTLADAGASGAVGPNLDELAPDAAAVAEVVTNGRGAMPAFGGQLSEEDIANVAAYVSSAAGG